MKYFYSNTRIHIHVSRILSAVSDIYRPCKHWEISSSLNIHTPTVAMTRNARDTDVSIGTWKEVRCYGLLKQLLHHNCKYIDINR